MVTVREYRDQDLPVMLEIWNEVVRSANAFPQTTELDEEKAKKFFGDQVYTGVAEEEDGTVVGLYILHPNNIGRCGHIGNASYAVQKEQRGKHIGEALVTHCLKTAKRNGFRILQFNAVVMTNHAALHLYEKLGFQKLGVIPGGFRLKDGTYEDIQLFYITL